MILLDAGPMIACMDKRDPDYPRCVETLSAIRRTKLVTTWPCVTEAMHILGRTYGHPSQAGLWRMLNSGLVSFFTIDRAAAIAMEMLMAKYRDLPMDLADASLVAAAERLGARTVFTLDSDFRVYRLDDGSALDVTP